MRFLARAAAAAFVLPTLVSAQQSPRDTASVRLDTVVVSATREARSLTQVPFAVSVVSSEQWKGRSGYGLDQALQQVPGVFAQSRYGTHDIRLTIRGFGARGAGDRSNAGTSRGIRVLLDGVPETEPDGRTAFDQIDLATIERIEVLRSNGSAAWGNAAGGIVSLSSMPEFDRNFAEVSQQSGSFGLLRTVLRSGTALGNGGKTWLSLTRTTFDGWRQHSDASRAQLVGGVSVPLANGGRVGVQLSAASNLFRIPGPLTPAQSSADEKQANPTYLARDERRFNRLMRLGVTLDRPIGERQDVSASLFVNPKYLQRSERNTFRDFNRYHIGGTSSWGLRMQTGEASHRLRVGGDFAYQDGSIQFYNLGPGNTRGTTLQQNKGEAAQNAGLFVQDEVGFGRFTLLVGARYDDLSYFYRDYITPAINATKRFQQVSPRGGLSWRAPDGTTLYASYGQGVEIPAGNETDPPATGIPSSATAINPLLDVVRSRTVEAGVRRFGSVNGRVLQSWFVDAALYSVVVNGEPMPYNGGRFYMTAGEVTRRGLELALSGEFTGGLSARLAGTFSQNRYDRYVLDSTYLGVPGATADFSGNDVAGLPGQVINATLRWSPTFARGLGIEVGAQHNNDYYADDRNAVDVPGYTTYRLGVDAERGIGFGSVARVALSVENLTGERYVASAFINPDYTGGQPLVYEAGLPRSVVVSVALRRAR